MNTAFLEQKVKTEQEPRDRVSQSLIFHLAISCLELDRTLDWYTTHFKCEVKRRMPTTRGAHLDFYGNQITFVEVERQQMPTVRNEHGSPLPHFGCVLPVNDWFLLKDYLLSQPDVKFDIEPHVKFPGSPSEHYTMFILDPSGNALEIKAFTQTQRWL
jgi:extradiol dioxygenase family protein